MAGPPPDELICGRPTGNGATVDVYVLRQKRGRFAKNPVQGIKRPGKRRAQDAKTGVARIDLLDDFQGSAKLGIIDAAGGLLPNHQDKERPLIFVFFRGTKNQQPRILFSPLGAVFLFLPNPEIR